jgi:hypothetical protein
VCKPNEKEESVYGLMQYLFIDNDLPLEHLDKKNKHHFVYANHWVTSKTMRKYIQNLVVVVEKELAKALPSKFGIYFDGWTHKKLHYLGIIATYIEDGELVQRLISMSPLFETEDDAEDSDEEDQDIDRREGDEPEEIKYGLSSSFGATTIYRNIKHVLERYYGKSFDNVTHLGGDNASVCIRVCELAKKPYDPCCSHLQNLETNCYMKHQPFLMQGVHAVQRIMKAGMRGTVAAELAEVSPVGAVLPTATRWSSNAKLFARYEQLEGVIGQIPALSALAPKDRNEKKAIDVATGIFSVQNRYCLNMQRGGSDPKDVHLAVVRDELRAAGLAYEEISKNSSRLFEYSSKYTNDDSPISNRPEGNKYFLSGVIKLQTNKANELTAEEKEAVSMFEIDDNGGGDEDPSRKRQKPNEWDDLADKFRVLANGTTRRTSAGELSYMDTRFVVGTNNACERLFSKGKRILTDSRGRMSPLTFEALIFLKANKDLWGQLEVTKAMRMSLDDCYNTAAPGSGSFVDVDDEDDELSANEEDESDSDSDDDLFFRTLRGVRRQVIHDDDDEDDDNQQDEDEDEEDEQDENMPPLVHP